MRNVQFHYQLLATIPAEYGTPAKPIKEKGRAKERQWYAGERFRNGILLVDALVANAGEFEAEMHYARGDITSILATVAFKDAALRAKAGESWKPKIELRHEPWYETGASLYFASPPVDETLAEKIEKVLRAKPRATETEAFGYLRRITENDGTTRAQNPAEAFTRAVVLAELVEKMRMPRR